LTGGNSTLRQHCRQHYKLYKERCENENIPISPHAIPPGIAKAKKGKKQKRIDEMLEKGLRRPETFTKDAIMHSVAQFVACDNQALAVADGLFFRNCLVTMRPKTISSELATAHEVCSYIHNECIDWLAQLKKDIIVRTESEKKKKAELTVLGCPRRNLDDSRLLDCSKYTNGVPWGYRPLDRCEGWEVGAP
jgi:hypothetical protein